MVERKSYKIQKPVAERFEAHFRRDNESQSEALSRLLDEAGVPKNSCDNCGDPIEAGYLNVENDLYCHNCMDVGMERLSEFHSQ